MSSSKKFPHFSLKRFEKRDHNRIFFLLPQNSLQFLFPLGQKSSSSVRWRRKVKVQITFWAPRKKEKEWVSSCFFSARNYKLGHMCRVLSFIFSRSPRWPRAPTRRWTRCWRPPMRLGTRIRNDCQYQKIPGVGARNMSVIGSLGLSGNSPWQGQTRSNSFSNSRWELKVKRNL